MPKKIIFLLITLISALFIVVAQASEPPPRGHDVIGVSSVSAISEKVDAILSKISVAMSNAGARLIPMGKDLLYSFLGISVVWLGIKFSLGADRSEIISNLMDLILKWGVAAWLLRDYATWGGWISSGFDVVIANFGGVSESGAIESLFKISLSVLAGVWGVAGAAAKTVSVSSLGTVGVFLITIITLGVVVIVFGRAMLIASVIILAASIFFNVLWMLGPLFIPFVIGWIFSPVFNNWLSYLISAGLYKVVAAALIVAISAFLEATDLKSMTIENSQNTFAFFGSSASDYSFNLLSIIMLLFFALTIEFLAKQIPAIASGLAGVRAIDVGVSASPSSQSDKPKSNKPTNQPKKQQ
jgi:hypothetical protein